MALMRIDIDEDVLAEAMWLSGATTKKDAVTWHCGSSLPGIVG
jgi:Arc/MetJ family transcription regulator